MIYGTVAGTLGGDAEIKHTQGGESFASFSVASNSKVKDEKVTTWVRCTMWGKRGATLAQYLTKGAKVTVVGSLSMRSYDKDGETKTSLECRVDDVALMGSKGDGNTTQARPATRPQATSNQADDFGSDDEIPF